MVMWFPEWGDVLDNKIPKHAHEHIVEQLIAKRIPMARSDFVISRSDLNQKILEMNPGNPDYF
jgi:hypothetical protein